MTTPVPKHRFYTPAVTRGPNMEYHGEFGLPLHSMGHHGGRTKDAILVYVRHMADSRFEPEPTADELRLVVEYCAYFINAPCWKWPAHELKMLRASIEHVKTPHELATWLWGCGEIGIDPL
jgi:hypothetical protein